MTRHCPSIFRPAGLVSAALLFAAFAVPARAATTSADVAVFETRFSPSPALPGTFVGYHISVVDAGPDAATNVVLTDVIPAHTTFVSIGTGASGIVCSTPPVGGTGTITCPFAPAQATAGVGIGFPFFLTLRLDPDAAGTIANTVTVSSDTPDPDLSNNSATAFVEVASSVPVSGPALLALGFLLAAGGVLLVRR